MLKKKAKQNKKKKANGVLLPVPMHIVHGCIVITEHQTSNMVECQVFSVATRGNAEKKYPLGLKIILP